MSFFTDLLDGGYSSAKSANEKNAAFQKSVWQDQFSLGASYLQKALAEIDPAYAEASAALGKAGGVATQQIMANQKQTLAAGQQALMDSGFGGTIAAQLPGQVAYQTNQQLAGLAENLGVQQGNLAIGNAQMKQNAYQSLAQFAQNKVNSLAQITPQYTPAGGGLIGAAGNLAGMYLGSKLPGMG